MKDKFIQLCKEADIIEMNGIILKYLSSSNALCYRVFGEEQYISLDELNENSFYIDNDWFCVRRLGVVFKLKFYKELCLLAH